MSKCQLCGLLITDEFPSGFGGTEYEPVHAGAPHLCLDAACSEIDRLRAENDRLQEDLRRIEDGRACPLWNTHYARPVGWHDAATGDEYETLRAALNAAREGE